MISRIIAKLIYLLQKKLKPEMIGGFSYSKSKDVRISNHTHISYPKNLTVGEQVFIAHFSYIDCMQPISIGRNVHIGSYVSILTHSAHNSLRLHGKHYCTDAPNLVALQKGQVIIGEYSSIGPYSIIMPGTTLGKGSLITANSYVNSGVYPDFAILKGNPAKIVGSTRDYDELLLERYPEMRSKYYLNDND
jgi:acetyltransferase-like isoleucine patch superfamily enzyme